MSHESGADQQEKTQHNFYHPRPCLADRFFFRWIVVFGHEETVCRRSSMGEGNPCPPGRPHLLSCGLRAGSPRVRKVMYGWSLRLGDTQEFGHLVVQKAFAGAIGLNPFAVNDKLRDGALAGAGHHFVGRSGRVFDVNLREGNVVFLQEALGRRGSQDTRGRNKPVFSYLKNSLLLCNAKALNRKERKGFRKERGQNKAASTS